MSTKWLIPLLAMLVLTGAFAAPVSAQPTETIDECQNADQGPGEDGPPGFVAGLVPNFISDLIGSLPVPNFVKSFFGAPTC